MNCVLTFTAEAICRLFGKESDVFRLFCQEVQKKYSGFSGEGINQTVSWLSYYMAIVVNGLVRYAEMSSGKNEKAAGASELTCAKSSIESGVGLELWSGIDFEEWEQIIFKLELLEAGPQGEIQGVFRWLTRLVYDRIEELEQGALKKLSGRAGTFFSAERTACDFFQPLFQSLFPRKLRHSMGEYYTPLWLSRLTLDDLGYAQQTGETFLDPCCGSGSFILAALEVLQRKHSCGDQAKDGIDCINQITGFDVNPLAVIVCRANLFFNYLQYNKGFAPNGGASYNSIGDLLKQRIRCKDFLLDFSNEDFGVSSCLFERSENQKVKRGLLFDAVASNPPWIAWDNLSEEYRRTTDGLWRRYGLFSLKGAAARHGGAKKDLSALFFYAAADVLESNGLLGMVLPRSLFQTQAAEGFRSWNLPGDRGLRVRLVRDFSRINIFDTPAAKAAVLTVEADSPTQYPVPFYVYSQKSAADSTAEYPDSLLCEAFQGSLSDPANPVSAWKIEPIGGSNSMDLELSSLVQIAGRLPYQARLGANTGGANGVYWLEIVEVLDHGLVRVRNRPEKSKKPVPECEAVIESELLYPLSCWKDVQRWRCADRGGAILVVQDPQTRAGWDRSTMERKYPRTLDYLLSFQDLLERRAAQIRYQEKSEFYSMYNIGVYTFSLWKTVWRRMDSRIRAAAVGPRALFDLFERPVFPQETCCFVPAESEEEACYLAGVLNSPQVDRLVQASSIAGSKSFGSPRVLSTVPLVRFDSQKMIHCKIACVAKAIQKAGGDAPELESELSEWTQQYFENVRVWSQG